MERIYRLDRYQKGILILLLVMLAVFAVVYYVTISRVGLLYNEEILIPGKENGNTTYTGKINGIEAVFTVTPEKTVTFRYGEKTYGPYTVTEDPTAVPQGDKLSDYMTGYEIRDGEEIYFRGGGFKSGGQDGYWMLYNEDGTDRWIVTVTVSNGLVTDSEGNVIDSMKPPAGVILDLVYGPKLINKGHLGFWCLGVLFSAVTAVSMMFADELFRWNLRFQIRNAELAEPSDYELSSRYIGWTVMPVAVFILYMVGLSLY